jgi:DNA-binding MarR family transcriptional regulator
LQRNLGVAKNILATRLKALSAEGIVQAAPSSDGSVYQEYTITTKGRALLPTLVALAQWSSEYLFERREVRSAPIDAKRRPLKKLVLHSEDGQLLDAGEILIKGPLASHFKSGIIVGYDKTSTHVRIARLACCRIDQERSHGRP